MTRNLVINVIQTSLAEIALEKLKETGKGFWEITATFDGETFDDSRFLISAHAGYQVDRWLKITLTADYDPAKKTISGGLRVGGEI